jgi:hypothetical protein
LPPEIFGKVNNAPKEVSTNDLEAVLISPSQEQQVRVTINMIMNGLLVNDQLEVSPSVPFFVLPK